VAKKELEDQRKSALQALVTNVGEGEKRSDDSLNTGEGK